MVRVWLLNYLDLFFQPFYSHPCRVDIKCQKLPTQGGDKHLWRHTRCIRPELGWRPFSEDDLESHLGPPQLFISSYSDICSGGFMLDLVAIVEKQTHLQVILWEELPVHGPNLKCSLQVTLYASHMYLVHHRGRREVLWTTCICTDHLQGQELPVKSYTDLFIREVTKGDCIKPM